MGEDGGLFKVGSLSRRARRFSERPCSDAARGPPRPWTAAAISPRKPAGEAATYLSMPPPPPLAPAGVGLRHLYSARAEAADAHDADARALLPPTTAHRG